MNDGGEKRASRRRAPRWTPEVDAEIGRLRASGVRGRDIAKAVGATHSQLILARHQGLVTSWPVKPYEKLNFDETIVSRLRRYREEGSTWKECAVRLGVAENTLRWARADGRLTALWPLGSIGSSPKPLLTEDQIAVVKAKRASGMPWKHAAIAAGITISALDRARRAGLFPGGEPRRRLP